MALLSIAAVGVASVAVISMLGRNPGTTGRDPGPGATPSPGPPVAVVPPLPGVTYRDFAYDTSVVTAPTAATTQSKLWFAHGSWWAGLVQPATNRTTIFRLDRADQVWVDTGVLVDERPFADPDFLSTEDHLYVVSGGTGTSPRHAARVLRFTYDQKSNRYAPDPNFPVTINGTGATAVITRDGAATLWVTYTADGKVWIVHSLGHDAEWSAPAPLPVDHRVTPDDVATIVTFGPGKVGVMWSDQADDRVSFSVHADGDPSDTWSPPEAVLQGIGRSGSHINLTTYPDVAGPIGVVAALETSQGDLPNANPLAPLIVLATRAGDGTWSSHLVSQVRDRATGAIVMVDDDARMFYVAATSPSRGGEILYKRSPIDSVVFETGRGDKLVSSPADPDIKYASSTKQGLTKASGLVVLAADDSTGRYLHSLVDLGGGLPAVDPTDPSRPDRPAAPETKQIVLLDDDFEPWPIGNAKGTGWTVREGDPPGALTIVDDGKGQSLGVGMGPGGSGVRGCRDFADVPGEDLEATLRVRLHGLAASDATIVSLRGSGGEVGSLRVSSRGRLSWFDGSTKVRSEIAMKAGSWYRVTIDVDQAHRTYGFTITTDKGKAVAKRSKLDWRTASVPSAREACLETGTGNPKHSIDLSHIRIVGVAQP